MACLPVVASVASKLGAGGIEIPEIKIQTEDSCNCVCCTGCCSRGSQVVVIKSSGDAPYRGGKTEEANVESAKRVEEILNAYTRNLSSDKKKQAGFDQQFHTLIGVNKDKLVKGDVPVTLEFIQSVNRAWQTLACGPELGEGSRQPLDLSAPPVAENYCNLL
jgi:hypothetical protein